MHCVGVCNLKLWRVCLLLFHVALSLHPSFARQVTVIPTAQAEGDVFQMLAKEAQLRTPGAQYRSYNFYQHNESRVAQAVAEIEASFDGARSPSKFPDWNSSDECYWNTSALYLGVLADGTWYSPNPGDSVDVQFIAVDACSRLHMIYFGGQPVQISSEPWHTPNPEVGLVESRFKKVLVAVRAVGLDILGEGVYCTVTGTMQLVGCILNVTSQDMYEIGNLEPEIPKLMARSGDCAVSLTLQYPPRDARWNWQRVLKFALRSTRDASDPLYFHPVKRDIFYPYSDRFDSKLKYSQEQLATGGRMLLLLLGLVSVALQIQYGGHNEEALPFVSLSMLGIQIANHVSQTSLFKDLQIGRYQGVLHFRRRPIYRPSMSMAAQGRRSSFFNSTADFDYYGAHGVACVRALPGHGHGHGSHLHVRVDVSQSRRQAADHAASSVQGTSVRRGSASGGAAGVATVTLFAIVGVIGILANVVDQSSAFEEPGSLFGNSNYTAGFWELTPMKRMYHFVSPGFYERWYEQWGVVNKITGLWVSMFLVLQLLGNWRWDVQGRPLSRWFYVGLPLLQSLPPLFTIANYFQLLPIVTFYDPYLDSFYGMYENPTPWWQMGVVSCSALVVVAVHLQFATSFRSSRAHSSTETPAAFTNL